MMDGSEKIFNLDIERALLSTAIFDPEIVEEMIERLKPEHFAHPFHATVMGVISDLHSKGMPIDEVFVKQAIEAKGAFDEVLYVDVLSANPISDISSYIGEVIDKYRRRRIIGIASKVKQQAEEAENVDDVIDVLMSEIGNMDVDSGERHCKTFDEMKRYYEEIGKPPLYETGIRFIDKTLNGGFQLGQMFFISGHKESGKTFILTKILENVSRGHKVGFFSLEFGSRMYVENMTKKHGQKYSNSNIYINDWAFDISEVEREIRYQHKYNGVKFWGIDSQLRLTNKQMAGSTREIWLGDIFSRLARLAVQLDILIMIIVQVSKEGYKSDEPTVKGCVDADHEAITWLHLTKLKGEGERRSALWVKNKQTYKHPKILLDFDPRQHTFKEVRDEEIEIGKKKVKVKYEVREYKMEGEEDE